GVFNRRVPLAEDLVSAGLAFCLQPQRSIPPAAQRLAPCSLSEEAAAMEWQALSPQLRASLIKKEAAARKQNLGLWGRIAEDEAAAEENAQRNNAWFVNPARLLNFRDNLMRDPRVQHLVQDPRVQKVVHDPRLQHARKRVANGLSRLLR